MTDSNDDLEVLSMSGSELYGIFTAIEPPNLTEEEAIDQLPIGCKDLAMYRKILFIFNGNPGINDTERDEYRKKQAIERKELSDFYGRMAREPHIALGMTKEELKTFLSEA